MRWVGWQAQMWGTQGGGVLCYGLGHRSGELHTVVVDSSVYNSRLHSSLRLWPILTSSSALSSLFSKERKYDKISKDHLWIFSLFIMLGLEIGIF